MRQEIYDSYIQEGWHLFALYKTEGEGVKGKYATPKGWNDLTKQCAPYNSKSIYGGVPPADIVVLDWDVKNGKKGAESLSALSDKLETSIGTAVRTPSGGGHCYVRIPKGTLYSKAQEAYPDIDFQGHGREWVMLGDQNIEGYGEYKLVRRYYVNELLDLSSLSIRKDIERGEGYKGIDIDTHFMVRPSETSIRSTLAALDPDMSYEGGWQNVIMALNSWDLGGDQGLALAIEWSQGAVFYSATEEEIETKYYACIADTPNFYLKLIGMVNKETVTKVKKRIQEVGSIEELEQLAKEISESDISNNDRDALLIDMVDAGSKKEVYGKKKSPHLKKLLKRASDIPKGDQDERDASVYLHGNKYVLRYKKSLVEDLTTVSIKSHLEAFGFKVSQERDMIVHSALPIDQVKHIPDYTIEDTVSYTLDKRSSDSNIFTLTQRNNPIFDLECFEEDSAIITEFVTEIWKGKVIDIVRLVALSIKYGESKLNRLMVVAPSNSGKSEIATMLNFQKITMKRLLNGMRGDKGVGGGILEGIKRSGLLLIDEANASLEQEIKDMDKELHIDQFQSNGTQTIPLLFTILTSTHKTATRNNSDELYNRFLQIELTEGEMDHHVTSGILFNQDRDKYTEVIQSHLRRIFRETIQGDSSREELKELQAKYRLPTNNDLDEFLYVVSENIIKEIRSKAKEGTHGDYIQRKGDYFVKRKGDIHELALELLREVTGVDHGKYAEKLTSHFVGAESISIKLDGTPLKYYPLYMGLYLATEEQKVISAFSDLDLDEL
jgi:hypothetical protein